MPLDRPAYAALIERMRDDFVAQWTGVTQDIEGSDLRHYIDSQGTLNNAAYAYAEGILQEIVPTTASLEGLKVWGQVFATPQKPASAAVGSAVGEATQFLGLTTGTLLTSEDGGVYEVSVDAVADIDGVLTISVRALDTGTAYNLDAGASLTLVTPEPGVEDTFIVAFPGVVGADDEDVEAYRARIIGLFRYPPQGGALHDCRRWALEVPGVARAWALPADVVGLGSIVVYVATAEDEVVPPDELLEQVRAHITARKREDANVIVAAPAVVSQHVLAFIYFVPESDDARVRELAEAAVRDVFRSAPAVLDPLPDLKLGIVDVEPRFYRPQIEAAIGDAIDYSLMLATPGSDLTPDPDTLTVYVPGTITLTLP